MVKQQQWKGKRYILVGLWYDTSLVDARAGVRILEE